MFIQVVALASVLALANAGYLLGGGIGGGIGGGLGYGGGLGLGGGLGYGGGLGIVSGGIGYGGYGRGYGARAVDYYAPPKYEYTFGVHDPHTGDYKQKAESRVGGLTRTQYGWAQQDRQVQEARVIASH